MIAASVLDALLAAGATAEMIVAAVKADAAIEQDAIDTKRAKDAERQRRHRMSRTVTVTNGDSVTEPLSPLVPPKVFPEPLSNNPPISPNPQPTKASAKFDLPGDIPAEPFDAFVEMRRKIRKPLSDHAKHLAVLRLRKLRDEEGWPPGDVLNHCTLNSYQGIYPPKGRNNAHPAAHQSNPNPRSRLLDALNAADEAIARSTFDEDHAGAWLALPSARTG